jgi:hypothetical protein
VHHKLEKQSTLERSDNCLNEVMSQNWLGGTEKNHKNLSHDEDLQINNAVSLSQWFVTC